MRPAARVALFAAAAAAIAACSGGDESAERSWEPEVRSGPEKGCAPKTCESLGLTCGTHDDGCGGTVDCGADCVQTACVPKTCKELGRTCGKHDDACGGIVDCGACKGCAPDAKEPNDTADRATDLGAMTDSPASVRSLSDLSVSDGDEDWFRFTVADDGFLGNPTIKATVVNGAAADVSIYFMCTSQTNYSECPVEGQKKDNLVGVGCMGKSTATLQTSCSGINESGVAYVRVRKAAGGAAACVSYRLEISVTE